MQTKLFPLFDDAKDVLRIMHDADFQHCSVEVNDHEIAAINKKTALQQGVEYDLGGGNRLHLQLLNKYFVAKQLQVLVNGEAVEGSDTHPQTQFKWVLMVAFIPFLVAFENHFFTLFYAANNFMHGADSLLFVSNIENVCMCLVNIGALWALYHYRSASALYIIIGFYTYKICGQLLSLQIIITTMADATNSFTPILFNILILALPTLYLVREGLPIIKALKNNENDINNANILDSK